METELMTTGDIVTIGVTEGADIQAAEEDGNRWKYDMATTLKEIAPIALTVEAVVFNSLVLLVLLRPSMRKISTCIYQSAIAMTDLMYVIVWFLPKIVLKYAGEDITCWMKCKVYVFCLDWLPLASHWLLVAATLERLFVVYWPLRARVFARPARSVKVILAILTISALLNSFMLITVDGQVYDEDRQIHKMSFTSAAAEMFYYVTFPYVTVTFTYVLPEVLTITFSAVIIARLVKQHRRRMNLTSGEINSTGQSKMAVKDEGVEKTSIMLVSMAVAFVVLLLPTVIVQFMFFYGFFNYISPTMLADLILAKEITYFMFLSKTVVNFIVYYVTSTNFRAEFKNIFTCKY